MLHRLIRYSCIYASHTSSTLNRSFCTATLQSNAVQICNRVMLDFYQGLPHMFTYVFEYTYSLLHMQAQRTPMLFSMVSAILSLALWLYTFQCFHMNYLLCAVHLLYKDALPILISSPTLLCMKHILGYFHLQH